MKNNSFFLKKFVGVILSFVTVIGMIPLFSAGAENESVSEQQNLLKSSQNEYRTYLNGLEERKQASQQIVLDTAALSDIGAVTENINGKDCVRIDSENRTATYRFNVSEAGMYALNVTYYDLLNDELSLRLSFAFDGETPYVELENVIFSKIFETEGEVEKDSFGNEIRPSANEKQRFNSEWADSETGMFAGPYQVYLEKGDHTLTVGNVLGAVCISEILLSGYTGAAEYEEYIKSYSGENKAAVNCRIEAEDVYEMSDYNLAPTIDSTNAGMSPASSTKRVVNSFGQGYWHSNGQWGSWRVPENTEPGLYAVSFRAKQAGTVGITSYRTLKVNGEVPFAEAQNVAFEYNSKWQIKTLGDDTPYLVYLEPGDILTLEATTGEMADIIGSIYTVRDKLNDIYQSIIIITGTEPDPQRDYNIQKEIPTLLDDFKALSKDIETIGDSIAGIMGETNTKVYFMRRFVTLIDGFVDNYHTIVPELATFKSYLDSFAAQVYDFNSMLLELDWIELSAADSVPEKANADFWESLVFEVQRFFYTFAAEYGAENTVDSNDSGAITVWCSLGRDQAQAVNSLIQNDFVPKSGIAVDLKMTTTVLAEAILAGREPDVSLSVTQDIPIDLALRGQVMDLKPYLEEMPEEYLAQFNESSWIPFTYNGGIYAMPMTQDFYMMFYREDILSDLGIELPETWDDLYDTMRKLEKNGFQVGIREADSAAAGISTAIPVFDMFLYQNGGTYFNDDLTETAFETQAGKDAFMNWVSLYRDYGIETSFDMLTRFRSGEMPIIITSYSFYQTVAATAQEISGRWKMAVIPGTLNKDGSVNRTETSTVTGAIVLKKAENRGIAEQAFDFVSWWAGADVQTEYITAMESIQGIAGRLPTANNVTFERLSWTQEEKRVLTEQREWVTAVNQIPGTYIINRSLTNALRTSYASPAVDPLRQLGIQNRIMNDEIQRKRKEFDKNN